MLGLLPGQVPLLVFALTAAWGCTGPVKGTGYPLVESAFEDAAIVQIVRLRADTLCTFRRDNCASRASFSYAAIS